MTGHSARRPLATLAAVAAAVAVPFAAQPATAHADSPDRNGDSHTVTVMTRNLDEGTDFGYILAAVGGQIPFDLAVGKTYEEVLASDVCGRAARIADEIAAAKPDLVSLQEVARWTGPTATPCAGKLTTTLDARTALEKRLAADGSHYVEVGKRNEFNSSGIQGLPISFLDRDVLLARVESEDHLSLENVRTDGFDTLVPIPALNVTVQRGWISVDATVHGRTVRVIATHLESFSAAVQTAQAAELLHGPAKTSLPVILAGDLNTGPGADSLAAYNLLTSSGAFVDTWSVTHPGVPGFTDSFYTEDPLTSATPSQRIDLVLVRGNSVPVLDYLVGQEIPHPSDHAGVVARVRILSRSDE